MLNILLTLFIAFPGPVKAEMPAVDPYQEAVKQLKDSDAMVRRQGADKLGQMRKPEAVPELMPLLNDANAFVRSTAIDSLGLLRSQEAAAKISKLLVDDKDPGVRQSAATALAYIGDPASADALAQATKDAMP